jgi:hypothetical protein
MADHWHYRIEPYRRIPGDSGLTPVKEEQAELWLGFRDKGDDHRCFGAFPSRADAEKAVAILKEEERQPQPAREDQRGQGYHLDHRRNGTEDEIIICAPDGRHMAYLQFWDEGWDGPGVGHKEAKADAELIIAALNATRPAPSQSIPAHPDTRKAYHARAGHDAFGQDAIDIRAPGGRSMVFVLLEPDDSREDRAQAKADARLIVNAMNAYQPPPPERSRKEDGIRGAERNQLDAQPEGTMLPEAKLQQEALQKILDENSLAPAQGAGTKQEATPAQERSKGMEK